MPLRCDSLIVCVSQLDDDHLVYVDVASNSLALEEFSQDAEEDEKLKLYTKLASFILGQVKDNVSGLIKPWVWGWLSLVRYFKSLAVLG
jgi:hypothetical protein